MNAQLLESVCLHESSASDDADYVLIDADVDDSSKCANSMMQVEEHVNFDDEAYDHCEDTDIFLSSKWNVSSMEEDFSMLADVCEDREQYDSARTSNLECSLTFVSDDEDEDLSVAISNALKDDDESVASVVTTTSQTGKRASSASCGAGSASTGGSRLSNKKRRRKMKKLKKEAAAAAAAERLMKQNAKAEAEAGKLDESDQQRKSAQLAVACATKTLAAYKEEQEKRDLARGSVE